MHSKEKNTVERTERPLFRKGQELTAERLNLIQEHQTQRLRQALLGVAGPGIVYGFALGDEDGCFCHPNSGKLYISCGLAIDAYGRQLYWPGGWVGIEDLPQKPEEAGKYTLQVHYGERRTDSGHRCGCPDDDADWVEEGVVFTLIKGCKTLAHACPSKAVEPCHNEYGEKDKENSKDTQYDNSCISQQTYIASRLGGISDAKSGGISGGAIPPDAVLKKLCEYPAALCYRACGDWVYDHEAGLPLACLELEKASNTCEALKFSDQPPLVEGYRPQVYRNSLLYELINRCHVNHARVDDVSFKPWLEQGFDEPIAWYSFIKAIKKGISVHFSKPILASTLHAASVFVTAVVRDKDTYFQDLWRLPVDKMEKHEVHKNSKGQVYAQGLTLTFNQGWIHNQLESELSRFHFGAIIELTIRSALLRDICGNMLDGRPLDFPDSLADQAMPGTDFIAPFCVDHRPQGGTPKNEASPAEV